MKGKGKLGSAQGKGGTMLKGNKRRAPADGAQGGFKGGKSMRGGSKGGRRA